MSTAILPQIKCTTEHPVLIEKYDEQVVCQALILRLLEDARFFIQRTSGGTLAHQVALRMFDDLVTMNGVLNIGDDALASAHEMKKNLQ